MDLTEAEDIKKRWEEYKELCKKDLHDSDNHDGMIIHLEQDILECEVKWALGSITMNKASGSDKQIQGIRSDSRVPEELRTEVCDIAQETGIKTIPKKKRRAYKQLRKEEKLEAKEKRKDIPI